MLNGNNQDTISSQEMADKESQIIEDIIKKRETGWDEIGFSRPIGGFFYNYSLLQWNIN